MIFSTIVALLSLFCGCEDKDSENTGGREYIEITVDASKTHQKFHGFGASDAWSCQFVGKNWPETKKNKIADYLFSKKTDSQGNPQGIGLDIWRFNIGGGSAEQGSASGISDKWRRAESFMKSDKSFDISKQSGQRWFLKAAKNRGVNTFIGFLNTPPVALTKNGKAFSSGGSSYNMAERNYSAYSEFLADVSENLKQYDGVHLDYISPFNEPQWDWKDGGQEGSPATNQDIYKITKEIDKVFKNRNISTKLEIPESAQLNYIYEKSNKPLRGEQAFAFFDSSSEYYLGNLSTVANKIAGHSYYTTWPLSNLSETRKKVKNAVESISSKPEFWMSEYCILENNEEIKGNKRDLTMKSALYLARLIYADLVLANAASWQWWLAVSPYDYKDGLVYIDHNENDGNVYDSKMLWTMGNFSRFIKPDMLRTSTFRNDNVSAEQALEGIMPVAFVSEDKQKSTITIVNYKSTTIPVKVNFKGLNQKSYKVYITNGEKSNNLKFIGSKDADEIVEIPAKSVVTLTNVD